MFDFLLLLAIVVLPSSTAGPPSSSTTQPSPTPSIFRNLSTSYESQLRDGYFVSFASFALATTRWSDAYDMCSSLGGSLPQLRRDRAFRTASSLKSISSASDIDRLVNLWQRAVDRIFPDSGQIANWTDLVSEGIWIGVCGCEYGDGRGVGGGSDQSNASGVGYVACLDGLFREDTVGLSWTVPGNFENGACNSTWVEFFFQDLEKQRSYLFSNSSTRNSSYFRDDCVDECVLRGEADHLCEPMWGFLGRSPNASVSRWSIQLRNASIESELPVVLMCIAPPSFASVMISLSIFELVVAAISLAFVLLALWLHCCEWNRGQKQVEDAAARSEERKKSSNSSSRKSSKRDCHQHYCSSDLCCQCASIIIWIEIGLSVLQLVMILLIYVVFVTEFPFESSIRSVLFLAVEVFTVLLSLIVDWIGSLVDFREPEKAVDSPVRPEAWKLRCQQEWKHRLFRSIFTCLAAVHEMVLLGMTVTGSGESDDIMYPFVVVLSAGFVVYSQVLQLVMEWISEHRDLIHRRPLRGNCGDSVSSNIERESCFDCIHTLCNDYSSPCFLIWYFLTPFAALTFVGTIATVVVLLETALGQDGLDPVSPQGSAFYEEFQFRLELVFAVGVYMMLNLSKLWGGIVPDCFRICLDMETKISRWMECCSGCFCNTLVFSSLVFILSTSIVIEVLGNRVAPSLFGMVVNDPSGIFFVKRSSLVIAVTFVILLVIIPLSLTSLIIGCFCRACKVSHQRISRKMSARELDFATVPKSETDVSEGSGEEVSQSVSSESEPGSSSD